MAANKADISTETVGDNQGLVQGDFTGELSCLYMSDVSVLYCTVLYCTVMYCTVLSLHV